MSIYGKQRLICIEENKVYAICEHHFEELNDIIAKGNPEAINYVLNKISEIYLPVGKIGDLSIKSYEYK